MAPRATRNDFRKDAIGLTGEALQIFEAALKEYTSALEEWCGQWDERVKGARTYSDVCMKQERDGERLGKPFAISALGEMSLKKAKAVLALEYRCACACVWCGRAGEQDGAMRCDGCAGRQARSRATTATRTPP